MDLQDKYLTPQFFLKVLWLHQGEQMLLGAGSVKSSAGTYTACTEVIAIFC